MRISYFFAFLLFAMSMSGCKNKSSDVHEVWEQTLSTAFGRMPIWSPDGEQILFGNDVPGSAGLYLWDLSNDPVELHDELPAHNWDYSWSPDGNHIAFSSPGGAEDSLAGIWVYTLAENSLTHVFENGRDVSWLYNSSELLFRIDNLVDNPPGIYRLDLSDESNNVMEATLLIENGHNPKCSSQNDYIAYSDNEIDGKLHIVDLDLREAYLSAAGAVHWNWSYDGYKLAYIANDYSSGSLSEVMWAVDLHEPENADTLARWATYPACDQDGNQVVFVRVQLGRVAGMWLYREGDGERRIAIYGQNPSFCPTRDIVAANSAASGIRILTRIS